MEALAARRHSSGCLPAAYQFLVHQSLESEGERERGRDLHTTRQTQRESKSKRIEEGSVDKNKNQINLVCCLCCGDLSACSV